MEQRDFLDKQFKVYEKIEDKFGSNAVSRMIEMQNGEVSKAMRNAVEGNNAVLSTLDKTTTRISSFVLQLVHSNPDKSRLNHPGE
jgi:hypothetical protein